MWPSEAGTPLSPTNLRRLLHRYQRVTDSLRQDAADAIDRSIPVKLPVNVVAPGEIPGAT